MLDWVRTGEPDALVRGLDGPLFFPVTPFDSGGRFNPETYRHHVRTGIEGGAAAVFSCCGTGEFFALEMDDYAAAELLYLNGTAAAEMTQLAYRALGVSVYSSAAYGFAPNIAMGDDATARALIDAFYGPLVRLRDQGSGYAVSLIEAGVRMQGLDVGQVRAPLAEPKQEHVERLAQLIEAGNRVVRDL